MSNGTEITLVGNLVDEVEMRFLPNGTPVCKFRVASTPRKFNRDTNAWEDDKDAALFLTCSVWRQAAENAAESLQKGMRVVIQGRLKSRSYEDREGVKRTVFEVEAEEVAVSLKMATAKVSKVGRSGGNAGGQSSSGGWGGAQQASSQDPWASQPAAAGSGWGAQQGGDTAPPF